MNKIILVFGALVGVALAGSVLFFAYDKSADATFELQKVEEAVASKTVHESPPVSRDAPPGFKEYKNGRFRFSILIPETMSVKESMETATSHSLVFTDAEKTAFQMFIVSYPEQQITDERFRLDVPSGVRENIQNVTLDGISAVRFTSEHETLGETSEVWFIANGYLYEVTTYKQLEPWMESVLSTWQFIQ